MTNEKTWQAYFQKCAKNTVWSEEVRAEFHRLTSAATDFALSQAFVHLQSYDLLAPDDVFNALRADLITALKAELNS